MILRQAGSDFEQRAAAGTPNDRRAIQPARTSRPGPTPGRIWPSHQQQCRPPGTPILFGEYPDSFTRYG